MNKTVALLNQWAEFEVKHPDATPEDFCRYFLVSSREKETLAGLFEGELPPRSEVVLIKLIDRIARLHSIYIQIALKDLKLSHFEEFSLLSAIAQLETPRKTEVIYHTINELSTGLSLLSGLIKKRCITEYDDPEDKRSKRLKLTPKGEKLLFDCYKQFSRIPEMMLMEVPEEDLEICIQLLKNVEIKYSKLWLQHKGKPFDRVFASVTGKKGISPHVKMKHVK
jgi:DNA-binding MarR family transcriptional regulator